MTEEQIKNILSICNKLDDLKQVKKEISIKEGFDTVTLRYYYDNAYRIDVINMLEWKRT